MMPLTEWKAIGDSIKTLVLGRTLQLFGKYFGRLYAVTNTDNDTNKFSVQSIIEP